MANPIDRFFRFLKDDYVVGVETATRKPTIYIDPDQVAFFQKHGLNSDTQDAQVRFMAEHLDAQYQGISTVMSRQELLGLYRDSLKAGPFAHQIESGYGVGIVNRAKNGDLNVENILKFFHLESDFIPAHMKPVPGTSALWKQMLGEHEGQHLNQEPSYHTDPLNAFKRFAGEVDADRQMIRRLRAAGHHDVAQAWIDIRALKGGIHGEEHASSLFLNDDEGSGEPTPAHFEAALSYGREMRAGVSARLCITEEAADQLQRSDPQKFAKAAREALEAGEIPAIRKMTYDETIAALAKKMSVTVENLQKLDSSKIALLIKAHEDLTTETGLVTRSGENPHVATYIRNYLGAIERRFQAETPPPPRIEEPPLPPEMHVETQELRDSRHKMEADLQNVDVMNKLVGDRLGLTPNKAAELFVKDMELYMTTLEALLKDPKTQLQTMRPMKSEEIQALIIQKMYPNETPPRSLDDIDSLLYNLIYDMMEREKKLNVPEDNPHLRRLIEPVIEEYKRNRNEIGNPLYIEPTPKTTPSPSPVSGADMSFNDLYQAATAISKQTAPPPVTLPEPQVVVAAAEVAAPKESPSLPRLKTPGTSGTLGA